MSTIRHFDSVPHIVRYGSQDEEGGESWVLFYRNAVCFTVKISRQDVHDTPFGKKWLELNKEAKDHRNFLERWNELCDCIIAQCIPVLEELAPSTRQWTTLEDHLRTPTYDLKLVASPASGDAIPEVLSGPDPKPSYEHHLRPFSDFQSLPDDIPRYFAQDLVCLGQEKDWRCPPEKMQTPAGEILYFLSCNRRAKNVTTGEVLKESEHRINAYCRLHSAHGYNGDVRIPKLRGVVVSTADRQPEDWDEQGTQIVDTWPQIGVPTDEPLVAGVLVSYISKAKTLAAATKMITDGSGQTELATSREKWKAQLKLSIQYLHDSGIAIGGRKDPGSSWWYINSYNVHVAPCDVEEGLETSDVWLMISPACAMPPRDGKQNAEDMAKFEEQKEMDWNALETLFPSLAESTTPQE